MPHRTPCKWKSYPTFSTTGWICSVCIGKLVVNGEEVCPFRSNYNVDEKVQHLITADERFYCISQLRKLEELRQG